MHDLPGLDDAKLAAANVLVNNQSDLDLQSAQKKSVPTEDRSANNMELSTMNLDTPSWKGWAELENDPMIFTTILRAWGVRGVSVDEVIPLDSILEKDPSMVIGLIFLSRWAASEPVNENKEVPSGLWFANQVCCLLKLLKDNFANTRRISTYSCATLALMNIINNQSGLSFGAELQSFKAATANMTPKERGLMLDDFQFVKDIHNSFSRELDRMDVDLRLKEEVQAANRRAKRTKSKFAKRKKRRNIFDDEENGFHFVAYVPAQSHVWRLDGMEPHPRDMGPIDAGDSWLMKIIGDLQVTMEASEADGTEFSLLGLNRGSENDEVSESEANVARMREDWSPFVAHMLRLHAERGDLGHLL